MNQGNCIECIILPLLTWCRFGEHIGSEDRSTEFKSGPGFINNSFRSSIAKYVSAFINSKENGKLYLGVDDGGMFCF